MNLKILIKMPETKEFRELKSSLKEEYLNKPVPKKYRDRYGKTYNDSNITKFAYAVAKAKGIKIHYT